ncbi:hypothetical protein QRX50_46805 [Amycolatopsis carbonis]|uniref:Uncharacterized protein n=1 Tax=Amycolatopsis carbonis TaxID=715471 RepID=A0A9Y2IF36_9PSEU|nr:hypothetical protein [Amycolatopsis sp. 2-15]WIX78764.1 hypothetical protein QRX50_46805 [Amycolatopsis sp. 2-15]
MIGWNAIMAFFALLLVGGAGLVVAQYNHQQRACRNQDGEASGPLGGLVAEAATTTTTSATSSATPRQDPSTDAWPPPGSTVPTVPLPKIRARRVRGYITRRRPATRPATERSRLRRKPGEKQPDHAPQTPAAQHASAVHWPDDDLDNHTSQTRSRKDHTVG